ncbi:NADP-dependent isocitrate dehydrogenase [Xanthomonas graminis]|nr:NADP-dependent isocitrate dehydrogenase [Xanthomonas translucens]
MKRIVCCLTDEAARLASESLLPVLRRFAGALGIEVVTVDVSLAARILSAFPECLPSGLGVGDPVADLRQWVLARDAVIVKPPCISASACQLGAAITELQGHGYSLPDYPERPVEAHQARLRHRYDTVRGSVVNGVLRQGTSVRRVGSALKPHLRARSKPLHHPPSPSLRSCIDSMPDGDFLSSEQAITLHADTVLRIEHVGADGRLDTLASGLRVAAGDVLDAAVMRRHALRAFLAASFDACKRDGLLFSLPLKCTSMKVSDSAIFASAVDIHFAELLSRHAALLHRHCYCPQSGIQGLQRIAASHSDHGEFAANLAAPRQPELAMVDARAGHSTLSAPGSTSIAVQMAEALLHGGRGVGADGRWADTRFVIPNRSEADVYRALLEDIQLHGLPEPSRIGSATVVGVSADAADEYGAQETTFEIERAGRVRIVDAYGRVLIEHAVDAGDIWRACRRSGRAIRHWIACALAQARCQSAPLLFCLDANRPRDRETLRHLRSACLVSEWVPAGISVHCSRNAIGSLLGRLRRGEAVVAATGNLLRDYLGEYLGAIEAGSSAMLEVRTELLNGGKVLEAGAAGCAPAIARDFLQRNHLRWNPVGDLQAWSGALAEIGERSVCALSIAAAEGLKRVTASLLAQVTLPASHGETMDLRVAHVHLACAWALELRDLPELGPRFASLAQALDQARARIEDEILRARRLPADLGGYYRPDPERLSRAMHPSLCFERILSTLD